MSSTALTSSRAFHSLFWVKLSSYHQILRDRFLDPSSSPHTLHHWVPSYKHMVSPTIAMLMTHSSIPDDPTVAARISGCLADISAWMKEHHLQLNLAKTELLVFPATQTLQHDFTIQLAYSKNYPIKLIFTFQNVFIHRSWLVEWSSHPHPECWVPDNFQATPQNSSLPSSLDFSFFIKKIK